VWFIGFPLVGLAGAIPSDPEYSYMGVFFAIGSLGVVLGLTLMPVALALGEPTRHNWLSAWGWVGAIVGAIFAAASTSLVLGTLGFLGESAPEWIPDVAGLAFLGVFVWILLAGILGLLGSRRPTASVLGVITGIGGLMPSIIPAVQSAFAGSSLSGNNFVTDILLGVVMWLSLPAWLLSMVWGGRTPRPDSDTLIDAVTNAS
jgi:hypothetical protein